MSKNVKTLRFILLLSVIIGCSHDTPSSYPSLVIYEGQKYMGHDNIGVSAYPDKIKIGSIQSQVRPGEWEHEELSSNELKQGTIYWLDEDLLGAKWNEQELKIYKKLK
ncbi:hypothetical protein [Paenibacillus sp. Marseille-Q4541]|uniref:hypothetical protein n=1 Tax=Paenibacillus sp. Marseille-Q4541 TaxID=2831522 RepID=UPI001BA4B846|nr:hypothetical protein [Paenibacillus sp. Marseille-Q4541]